MELNGQRVKRKRRRTRKFYLLVLVFLLVALLGSGLAAVFGYRAYSADYQRDLALARRGGTALANGGQSVRNVIAKSF